MNTLLKNINTQTCTLLAATLFLAMAILMPEMAFAAGGLDTINDQTSNVRNWLYAFIGIAGGVYLLICVLRLWGDNGYRLIPDFVKSVGFVALGAAVPMVMVWLWDTFKSGWN